MKAIILAAGYGRRMRPLTEKCHKTLLRVGGTTIIGRIVDSLLAHSISDIIIVTGYQAGELRAFLLAHYPGVPFTFVHNEHFATTNNIHSLNLAISSAPPDDDILLIESDLIYEDAVLEKLLSSKHRNAALVDRYRGGMDGTVVTVEDGVITSIIPPHLQGGDFDFSGKYKTLNVYRFSKEFCNDTFFKLLSFYSNIIDNNCYYELILGILIYMQRENIHAVILNGERWSELDDPNDLRVTEFIFSEQSRAGLLGAGCGGFWNYQVLDFAFPHNMHFPKKSLIAEIRAILPDLLANYGSCQKILNEKCAFFMGCTAENATLLNGAAQAFPILADYFAGKQILVPDPTFGEFTRLFSGCRFYPDPFCISLDEVRRRSAGCDVVVFVNPNNPTGSYLPPEEILAFAREYPEKTVLVDESFIDFAGHPGIISLLEKQPQENVIVLRSLSKVLGVPGLRLGLLYSCNRDFNGFVLQHIPIWNSNSIAEFFLEIILKHRDSLAASIASTIRDREEFAALLSEVPCVERVIPSRANFLVIELAASAKSPEQVVRHLLARKSILVKDISGRVGNGKHYLRLSVRLPEENRLLVRCLQEIVPE